ncbi:hypothetical protein NHF45_09845 [Maricaulaceae bacterium NA33B04]|nr:hypothetical protein [Maricaulaceae bacterium NA33B04]
MDIELFRDVLGTPGLSTWLRIVIVLFILGWIFTFTRMLKGGFKDITEISGSAYATGAERWKARASMPGRLIGLILASGIGMSGITIALFVQGSILIFIYQEVFAAG